VMAGVAPIAIGRGGIGAPGAYLLTGIVLALFAVGYTAMSRFITNAGAFYVYISRGLGRTLGLGAAFLATFSYAAIGIGLYGAFAVFAQSTFADLFGLHLAWQGWAAIGVVTIWYLGHRSIALSAKVLGVALVAESLILAIVAIGVIADGGASGLSLAPFSTAHVFQGSSGAMFAITAAAFIGFEATAIFSEEARDATRTVRRATYIAVGFLAIFYAFISWSAVNAFGVEEAQAVAQKDPTGMFFAMADRYAGTWAVDVMRVLIVTSCLAAILAFHNATSRYLFALGREGVLPRALATTHRVHRSPWVAGLVMGIVSAVVVAAFALGGLDPYNDLFIIVNSPGVIGIMVLQALAAAAVIGFFRGHRRGLGAWPTLVAPALGMTGLVVMIWLVLRNFELLTARGATTNWLLVGLAAAVFLSGIAVALRLRARRPDAYAKLATAAVD
jgi:amino acid transporter